MLIGTVDGDPVIYIGETDRELQTRVKEHQDSWAGGVRSRSATSAFSTHRTCTPAFDRAEVLHHASHPQLRLLLESAYIRTVGRRETVLISPNDANVNRNSGTRLQDRWLPIIRPSCTRPTTWAVMYLHQHSRHIYSIFSLYTIVHVYPLFI